MDPRSPRRRGRLVIDVATGREDEVKGVAERLGALVV
jgi:hypothetical protein